MEPKRLRKSSRDRRIAGVCGGVAEYLNVDPTIVRLIWACLAFTTVGIIAYILGWIIIPE